MIWIIIGSILGFLFVIFSMRTLFNLAIKRRNKIAKLRPLKTYNDIKGEMGENVVERVLNRLDGYLLRDYLIAYSNNNTHEIDFILVNRCGVFVIEVKNWSGDIRGDDYKDKWDQYLGDGEIHHQHYSPVLQNEKHCEYINNILKDEVDIMNIVVMVQNNTQHIDSKYTIALSKLYKELSSYEEVLTDSEVSKIYNVLLEHQARNVSHERHTENVQETKYRLEHNLCPRCGGKLILRHNENGDFYGCENYPRCKFTKKIDDEI